MFSVTDNLCASFMKLSKDTILCPYAEYVYILCMFKTNI